MKSYKNLFRQITSFDNLLLAARKAQHGKRFRPEVMRFNQALENELLALRADLCSESYQLGRYRVFYVNEPKHRRISAAPYRDRVLQHAVCNILAPFWDNSMIADNYACRAGLGTHQAIRRFNKFARQYPYALKCDISKFYDNIDHAILKKILFRRIPERRVRDLLAAIIDSGSRTAVGLPIGNLTSQWFANLYLNEFDWFVKQKLHCRGYVRYMDDFVFFARTKPELQDLLRQTRNFMQSLKLTLAGRKCNIYRAVDGVNFLGFKIFPDRRLLLKGNIHRAKRRLRYFQRKFWQGQLASSQIQQSIASWLGHAKWGDTYNLTKALLDRHSFYRGWTSAEYSRHGRNMLC